MNCCAKVIKYILFIFNLIFMICGILLIVLGSIMLVNLKALNNIDDLNSPTTIPILIIILGSIVTIISFFGCCGSIMENNCLTMTYAVFMFIILGLQIALIVWVAIQREKFVQAMGRLIDTIWDYNQDVNGYPMNFVELGFKCCGKHSYRDYLDIDVEVPLTCCGPVDTCYIEEYEHKRGCRKAFMDFWYKSTVIIHYFGIGAAIIEFFALFFACCLASNIRKDNKINGFYKET